MLGCAMLENIDGLSGLTELKYLSLSQCGLLSNIDALQTCVNLKVRNPPLSLSP